MKRILEYASLSLIVKQNTPEFLFGRKTRRIGEGLFNAPGGTIYPEKETIAQGTVREILGETNLRVSPESVLPRAVIISHSYENGTPRVMKIFVSLIDPEGWKGVPSDTEEMRGFQWFHPEMVPYRQMLPGDRLWLPKVLSGKYVRGEIRHPPPGKNRKPLLSIFEIAKEELDRLWVYP